MGSVKLFLAVAVIVGLAGCSALRPPDRYAPGANYGDSGKTACGTRQMVDGRVPFCGFPNDGDEYTQRYGTAE